MVKYQLLDTFKYSIDESVISRTDGVEAEYQRRINGYSTVVTRMYPKLFESEEKNGTKDPLFFVETLDVNGLISQIYRKSAEITNLNNDIPGVARNSFINTLLVNEIKYTNEIEGVETDSEEIGTIVGDLDNNQGRRLASTINLYLDTLKQKVVKINSLSDIRSLYDGLLKGEISERKLPDGLLFRNGPVRIGTQFETYHQPPISEAEINVALSSLIDFMNDPDLDPILKAVVSHFVFENTHPFYDGNGRTGRYLISAYLASKVDVLTGLSLSNAIRNSSSKYYKAFRTASKLSNRADVTQFIQDMLLIILAGQNDVIENLTDKKNVLNTVSLNIKRHTEDVIERRVLDLLAQSQLFNATLSMSISDNDIIEALHNKGVAKAKVKRYLKQLEDENEIVQTLGRPLKHKISMPFWTKLTEE